MLTELEYTTWKNKQLAEDQPDLRCLESLVESVNQFLNDPLHKPCLTILQNAVQCSELWIKDRNSEDKIFF